MKVTTKNQAILQSLLLPNETVLWSGSPNPLGYAMISLPTLADVFIALVLISVGAYIILRLEQMMVLPIVAEMFAYLVIIAGHVQILFAPAVGYFTAAGLMYAVTTERLLIVNTYNKTIYQQFRRNDLSLTRTEISDKGCVYFANGPIEAADGRRRKLGFEFLADPTQVAQLIDSNFRNQ